MNNIFIFNTVFFLINLLVISLLFYDSLHLRAVLQKRSQVESKLRQKKRQSEILFHLYEKANCQEPEEITFNQLLDDLENKLGWKMIAYWDFLENEQVLTFRFMRGLSQKYRDFVHEVYHDRIDIGTVAGGRAVSTKQPLVVNDWKKDPQLKDVNFLSEYGHVASFAAFPVISNLKIYGSLHIYGTKVGEFTLNEVQFFTTVTNFLAAVLEHNELTKGGEKYGNDIGKS